MSPKPRGNTRGGRLQFAWNGKNSGGMQHLLSVGCGMLSQIAATRKVMEFVRKE